MNINVHSNLSSIRNNAFVIPFNIETGTESTTSQSKRTNQDVKNNPPKSSNLIESFRMSVKNVKEFWDGEKVQKISMPKSKLEEKNFSSVITPQADKSRYLNGKFTNIKLKFNKNMASSKLKEARFNSLKAQTGIELGRFLKIQSLEDGNETSGKENINFVRENKDISNNLKMSKQEIYSTQENDFDNDKVFDRLWTQDISIFENDSETPIFKVSNFLSAPRKTAYFGK